MRWKISSALPVWMGLAVLVSGALGLGRAALGAVRGGGRSAGLAAGLAAVRMHCSGCHREGPAGHFDRISEERKSPEGWAMTIYRMRHVHGVVLSSAEQGLIIQYLSEVQGLAPSETRAGRFALERRANMPDMKLPDNLHQMCGRCHSLARVALQRRSASEWLKLINFHVGQFPTLEYQDGSRDIHWWKIASTQLPGELAKLFPLHSAAWRQWQARRPADLAGRWIVRGETAWRGPYYGTASIRRVGWQRYRARYVLHYVNGERLSGGSDALVYTGFEWRGTGTLGGRAVHEVYFASADGRRISGRWFWADHSELGGQWVAQRAGGAARVLAVLPRALKVGTRQRVIVLGRGLSGKVDLGPGTSVRVVRRAAYGLVLSVRVAGDAVAGYREVRVGGLSGGDLLVVYRHVDRVQVEPALAIARLGGGTLLPVDAQFRAIGYTDVRAADGQRTAVSLGAVPVSWSVQPFNAEAARRGDIRFAGRLTGQGRFLPAVGGPDPKRPFSADNTGDLSVVATHRARHGAVVGKAHLIVTVQRWVNPPIY